MLNPLSMVRRVVGLGALAAMGLVGAKSWLDEQRAELRHEYFANQTEFYRTAGMSSCLKRRAMEETALSMGWRIKTEGAPSWCYSAPGAEVFLRFLPTPAVPWIAKEEGWLAAFDGAGCLVEIIPSSC